MNFKIVKEKENKVLGRKETIFEVTDAKTTPTRKEIRKRIAALKNSREELVSVIRIKQAYGEHRATGLAHVYSNEKALKKAEPDYIPKRESKEKEKKKEEAPKTGKEEKTGQEPASEKKE